MDFLHSKLKKKQQGSDVTSVCRHHGRIIRGPLKPPVYQSTIVLRFSRGALNWASIMPRDVILWDIRYDFFFPFWLARWPRDCFGQLHSEDSILLPFKLKDCSDHSPFVYEQNGIPFGGRSKGKTVTMIMFLSISFQLLVQHFLAIKLLR